MNLLKRALRQLWQYGLGGVIGAILGVGVGLFLLATQFGEGSIRFSYDWPFLFRPHLAPTDLMLLYVDDESYQNLNQSYIGVWDRNLYARLLDRLKADGAKLAVFDIVFSDTNNPAADARFAQAMTNFGKVVLATDYARASYGRTDVKARQITPLPDVFADAADIGLDWVEPDEDLVIRQHAPYSPKNDLVPPLSVVAAKLMGASVTKDDKNWPALRSVNYYGPAAFLPNVSFYRALDLKDLKPGFFHNKVVFIGSRLLTYTAGERKDEYRSPYSRWLSKSAHEELFMPGVEVHATMFLNLMREDWLHRMGKFQEIQSIALLGALFGFGLSLLRPFYAMGVAVVGMAVITAMSYYMVVQAQYWFANSIVLTQIGVTMVWSIVFNSVRLFVQKSLMQQSLSMYVSPGQVKQIIKQPDILKPGATKQELSILFSDIANFTSMSEGMDSDELAKLMNTYFEAAVTNCIHETNGTVVKFIGDAIFAIWNAPERQEDHADRACRGALLLRDETSAFKGSTRGKEVRTRIGLHLGVANVGNFGSSQRIDYTALGENINLASRMEGLNKYMGTDVLITGDVERVVRGRFVTRFLGRMQLKGFAKAVDVYELVAPAAKAEESRPWREEFTKVLEQFQKRNFEAAEAGFKRFMEIKPKDGPSKFYLNQITELKTTTLSETWAGEIELHEK